MAKKKIFTVEFIRTVTGYIEIEAVDEKKATEAAWAVYHQNLEEIVWHDKTPLVSLEIQKVEEKRNAN
jgi:hypothetical protein